MKRTAFYAAAASAALLAQAALAGQSSGQIFTDNGTYTYYNLLPAQMGGVDSAGNLSYTYSPPVSNFHGAAYHPSDNTVTSFDAPNASRYTFVTSISENGKIAGYDDDSSFNQLGFVKNGNIFTDVSYPGPHGQVYLFSVNDSCDVAGLSSCFRGGVNFLLKNGVYTSIFDPLGSASSGLAYGLNNLDTGRGLV